MELAHSHPCDYSRRPCLVAALGHDHFCTFCLRASKLPRRTLWRTKAAASTRASAMDSSARVNPRASSRAIDLRFLWRTLTMFIGLTSMTLAKSPVSLYTASRLRKVDRIEPCSSTGGVSEPSTVQLALSDRLSSSYSLGVLLTFMVHSC